VSTNISVPIHLIRLSGVISLDQIDSWTPSAEGSLAFVVHRDARFSMCCEAIAIAKVRLLKDLCRSISVAISYTFPKTDSTGFVDPARFELLGGLFGLALLMYSTSVVDSTGAELRESLVRALWASVLKRGGQFGDGKKQQVLFRDPDYTIPSCLRDTARNKFPYSGAFVTLLRNIGRSLFGQRNPGIGNSPDASPSNFGSSTRETEALIFLYEASLNAHEHARGDTAHSPAEGIRGIIVEKYLFDSHASLNSRDGIPEPLRQFMYRSFRRSAPPLMAISLTVCDLGPGIHNTVNSAELEDEWDRLKRAVPPGTSRKAESDLERGQGFAKMFRSAQQLGAFVFIKSADVLAYSDFSYGCEMESESPLCRWPETSNVSLGSSLTLVWPLTKTSIEQYDLFPSSDRGDG